MTSPQCADFNTLSSRFLRLPIGWRVGAQCSVEMVYFFCFCCHNYCLTNLKQILNIFFVEKNLCGSFML